MSAIEEPTDLAGGAVVGGRYRLIGELGQGGSGRVLLVEDGSAAGAKRALKWVPDESVDRLRWEFERLRGLAHPQLARVYELLAVDETVFGQSGAALVGEYVPGATAAAAVAALGLDAQGRLRMALEIGYQVARALGAIHAHGLVHGDVKPDNVVVAGDRGAVLLDLGLCRRPGWDTTLSGTPGFLAPELFAGDLRFTSDLFSLGAMLRVLLVGDRDSPPATRTTGIGQTDAWFSASLHHARAPLPGTLPEDVRELLGALLQVDPGARPVRVGLVVERLSRLLARHGGGASEHVGDPEGPSPLERSQRLLSLPYVGDAELLDKLTQVLQQPGVVAVAGPAGAGRSRLVREAVVRRQRQLLGEGPVPSYQEGGVLPPSLGGDRIWHVTGPSEPDLPALRAQVAAARLDGYALTVVVETRTPVQGAALVSVGPLDDASLRQLLAVALPEARVTHALVDAARHVSGGLAGRLCRTLARGVLNGQAPSRPTVMMTLVPPDPERPDGVSRSARDLMTCLAAVGGSLSASVFEPGAPLSSLDETLSAGLVVRLKDGALALRTDLLAGFRAGVVAGEPSDLARLVAGFDRKQLTWAQRAMLLLSERRFADALVALSEAMQQARREGAPELAARLCELAALEVDRAQLAAHVGSDWVDAERASGRYDQAEALAQQLLPDAPSLAICLVELRRLRGDLAGAQQALADAPQPLTCDAWATAARLAFDVGDLEQARECCDQALRTAEPSAPGSPGDRAAEGRALVGVQRVRLRAEAVLSLCEVAEGKPEAAAKRVARALEQARPDAEACARLWSIAGWVERVTGRAQSALHAYRQAAKAADAAGEYHAAASALVNVGNGQLDAGDLGPAMEALREGARRLCLLGRDQDVWRALYNLAHARQLAGHLEGASWTLARAAEAAERCRDLTGQVLVGSLAAELALARGRLHEARAWVLDPGGSSAFPEGCPEAVQVTVLARAVEVAAGLDDDVRAQHALEHLAQVADADGTPASRAELALARVRMALRAPLGGQTRAAAIQLSQAAREASLEAGSYDLRLRALLLAARAAEDAGDPVSASARYGEARLLLDQAARQLPAELRPHLRAAPSYRRALEAPPARQPAATDAPLGALAGPAAAARVLAVGKRIVGERRLSHLYDRILDGAIDVTGAQRGYLVMLDLEGRPRVRAGRGFDRTALSTDPHDLSSSIVGRVLASGRPLSTTDAGADSRLTESQSVHALSLRSVLAVPLLAGRQVRGALYMEDRVRPNAFSEQDIERVSDLSELAVAALESAQQLRRERRTARRLMVARARLDRQVQAQAMELLELKRERGPIQGEGFGIICQSDAMRRVLELSARVACSELPVLITGESGTGKELLARALHQQSDRSRGAFVSENCSAIPEPLLESALFGHVRGAFTGADRTRQGLFEVAHRGTLFLDEIGDMSPAMQVRLLRVLQDGEVRPLGGERTRQVDVRVLAATHRDLERMVAEGTFREDLYYRLAVVTLRLPALRERPGDIGALVSHFVERYAPGRRVLIERSALSVLSQYAWPGNVRQLENEVRRALLLADDRIAPEHLSPAIIGEGDSPIDELDLKARVNDLERRLIRQALREARDNQTRAAKRLGISRYGLQKMVKRLAL